MLLMCPIHLSVLSDVDHGNSVAIPSSIPDDLCDTQ